MPSWVQVGNRAWNMKLCHEVQFAKDAQGRPEVRLYFGNGELSILAGDDAERFLLSWEMAEVQQAVKW